MMSLLPYIQPVGAALSLAKNLFKPMPKPAAPAPMIDFRAALDHRLNAADKAARSTLQQFDANGDGYLSRAELALGRDEFARLDLNSDGRLDLAELTRAQVQQQG